MLDHIIILVASLTEFQTDFSERFGIELTQGGAHPNLGTANLLADLGNGAYLEVLGPNPELDSPTGLGEFLSRKASPEVISFALRTEDMSEVRTAAESAGLSFFGPNAGSRRTGSGELLEWSGAYLLGHDFGDFVPFFIDWGETRHPSTTSVRGLEQLEFSVMHPRAEALANLYQAIGVNVPVHASERAGFLLRIRTPRGEVSYESYPTESLFSTFLPSTESSD